MKRKRMPSSIRKYIRREKARIRREFSDPEEKKKKIEELVLKFKKTNDNKRNIQPGNK